MVNFIVIAHISILILSIAINRYYYNNNFTPVTVYTMLWSVVGIVSNLGLYGYYRPSMLVNLTMLIGNLVFLLVFFASFRQKINFKVDQIYSSTLNIKSIWIFNLICFIFIIPFLINSLEIIRAYGFTYLRSVTGDPELGPTGSTMISMIIESIIKPVFIATAILSSVLLFSKVNNKYKIYTVVLSIIGISMYSILNSSRILIVNYIFYIGIAFLFFYKKSLIAFLWNEKSKVFVVVLMISLLLFMQNARSGDMSIIETFYIYYFSGPGYLSQIANDITSFGINKEFLFGSATFGFITNIFSNILILLTGEPQGSVYLLGSVLTNRQYPVSPTHLVNAMSTVYYNFLLDWGWIGIIIGPALLGGFSAYLCRKVMKTKNLFYSSLLVYWYNILIRTIFKWELLGIDFVVIVLVLGIFTNQFKFKLK